MKTWRSYIQMVPEWAWALLLVGIYCALFGRSLSWGWLGMDDDLLLRKNPYLNHGHSSFRFAVSDVAFGRRWTPLFWVFAALASPWGVLGYRCLSFALGLALVVSVLHVGALYTSDRLRVFAVAALFCASPLRFEVFGWGIGFLYALVGIFVTWSIYFHLKRLACLSFLTALLALLTYPVSAGYAVLWVLLNRRNWWGWTLLLCIIGLAAVQWALRRSIGFVPVQHNFGAACLVIPHYLWALACPLGTVPIVQPGLHWGVFAGAALLGIGLATTPRITLAFVVLLSPVVLAAATESFWFCGRYSLLPAIMVCFFLCRLRKGWVTAAILCAGLLFGLLTSFHSGFRSLSDARIRAGDEEFLLYGRKFQDPVRRGVRAASVDLRGKEALAPLVEVEPGFGCLEVKYYV